MKRRIPFWKLQSIGNDFPLVHLDDVRGLLDFADVEHAAIAPETVPASPSPEKDATAFLSRLSIAICDRRFGVGGDGLLAAGMEGEALRLRMFNPDGTEDFCGNGIRCAAVHAHAMCWVGEEFVVRHLDREVPTRIGEGRVETTLGSASYDSKRVPHTRYGDLFNTTVWSGMVDGHPMSLFGSSLTTGSTHTVILTDRLPDQESFEAVSPKIEVAPLWPDRTSVIWTQEVEPDHLKLLIWERGVGETLGCGTGASAAAVDYLRRKGRGGTVTVESKGGVLQARLAAWDAPITLIGVAEGVFRGEFLFEGTGGEGS